MSKSLLYVANTTTQTVPPGSSVALGSIIRRFGGCINVSGSTINLLEPGYYDIDVTATFNADAPGNVTLLVLQNGVPIAGGKGTETITTATTEFRVIPIATVARIYCCQDANLTIVVDEDSTATPNINNLAVSVMKA